MSTSILVILEDPTNDQFIAKPIIQKLAADVGKPRAKVDVLRDPKMRGLEDVFKRDVWDRILLMYPFVDLVVVVVDRDCNETRHHRLKQLLDDIRERGGRVIGTLAVQELEVWALAHYADELEDLWGTVREECHPKERYFTPFCKSKNVSGPGGGRKMMMREAMRGFSSIAAKCSEIEELKAELAGALE